jgi:hypothetical protein
MKTVSLVSVPGIAIYFPALAAAPSGPKNAPNSEFKVGPNEF